MSASGMGGGRSGAACFCSLFGLQRKIGRAAPVLVFLPDRGKRKGSGGVTTNPFDIGVGERKDGRSICPFASWNCLSFCCLGKEVSERETNDAAICLLTTGGWGEDKQGCYHLPPWVKGEETSLLSHLSSPLRD